MDSVPYRFTDSKNHMEDQIPVFVSEANLPLLIIDDMDVIRQRHRQHTGPTLIEPFRLGIPWGWVNFIILFILIILDPEKVDGGALIFIKQIVILLQGIFGFLSVRN